jgi:formamidopyrimidine-DNA glycosylase
MPELPEVETVRRGLEPAMEGARFARVEVRRGDLPSG